ncbi:MAG: class D sortase [Patescibacteria group bacterium]
MFGNSRNDEAYELNLHKGEKKHVFSELASQNPNYPPRVFEQELPRPRINRRKSAVKHAFKNLVERVAYSAAIFVFLFVFLNWQSYSQIISTKINEVRGVTQTSSLQELIDREFEEETVLPEVEIPIMQEETNMGAVNLLGSLSKENAPRIFSLKATKKFDVQKAEINTQKRAEQLLKVSKNPEQEKKNIPLLDMEVRPPDTRLIIPRLNRNVPIVQVRPENLVKRDWNALEDDMMEALRFGVVHFPGTAMPGEHGNIALTGHSSYFPWDPGRFKDVFVLLHDVEIGDNVLLYHKQTKYIYEVYEKEIVSPDEIDVLEPTADDRLTLITCSPVGTDISRLVVTAKLVKES